ncbi:GNAT family N-acetyltransferase [Pectobacterium brasiliense]|uniref:GNAT family N-acetyltransferase n=1 Tax=Pectobacterium brasiliense TaxID=180957 RepID=UPI001968C7F5|nr:GNAT family N-acetyltransferase [Pectobacterium brasiliense]MBN3099201.1 GNAT family N-acetyltransferase [Pectobacterium brasiliense]MBN3166243.1 GNAT family N-acetyltransferase [Pectobacterium brasiliense]MBN3229170.1 GNAT family N-acetyltransferase [Pectobacterium brasiliense]
MNYSDVIRGKFVFFTEVNEDDSAFILSLRLDRRFNRYINNTSPDVNLQRDWIRNQKERSGDYYFIICSTDGRAIGTISLYNINYSERTGEFGRWICNGNAIHSLESALLIHSFGFENIGLDEIYTNTISENKSVLNFHKRFGSSLLTNECYELNDKFSSTRGVVKSKDFYKIKESNYKKLEMLA